MAEAIRKVNIIGHLNLDTGDICTNSYAYLKNQIDSPIYEARRAGSLNRELRLSITPTERAAAYYYSYSQIKDAGIQAQPKVDTE